MKGTLRIYRIILLLIVSVAIVGCAGSGMKKEAGAMKHDHGMSMHHQHLSLNHALGMALQGSNLVMIGQMGMVPGMDDMSINHGKMMMKSARDLWTEMIEGKAMMDMHDQGAGMMNPMMAFTHQLGEAQLKVLDMLDKHANMSAHSMAVHHQHITLNHALKMALEGSDMVMSGQMGMAPGIDGESIKHGKAMMKGAKTLYEKTMSGKSMMDMHKKGKTPMSDAGMKFTHKMGEAYLKVLNLLESMK